MGLLAIATLPARAAIAGAELVVATGRLLAQDGPVLRAGGYEERIRVLLAPGALRRRDGVALRGRSEPNALYAL